MTSTLPSDPDIHFSNRLYITVTCQAVHVRSALLSNAFLRVSLHVSRSFEKAVTVTKYERAVSWFTIQRMSFKIIVKAILEVNKKTRYIEILRYLIYILFASDNEM